MGEKENKKAFLPLQLQQFFLRGKDAYIKLKILHLIYWIELMSHSMHSENNDISKHKQQYSQITSVISDLVILQTQNLQHRHHTVQNP